MRKLQIKIFKFISELDDPSFDRSTRIERVCIGMNKVISILRKLFSHLGGKL